MTVGELKRQLEGLDESVNVIVEVSDFRGNFIVAPLRELRDDLVGEILLTGSCN